MKKVIVCCTMSITSSLLVVKMRELIEERSLDIDVEALPASDAVNQISDADLIMLAPMVSDAKEAFEGAGAKKVVVVTSDNYLNYRASDVLDQAVLALSE